jgi:hypothetical protein
MTVINKLEMIWKEMLVTYFMVMTLLAFVWRE